MSEHQTYPIGTLKVVWVDKRPARVHSKLFVNEDISKAIRLANKKREALIMRLIKQKGDSYSWEILPGGRYSLFVAHIKFHRMIGIT